MPCGSSGGMHRDRFALACRVPEEEEPLRRVAGPGDREPSWDSAVPGRGRLVAGGFGTGGWLLVGLGWALRCVLFTEYLGE